MIIISDEVYTVVIVIIGLNCCTIKQQEGKKSITISTRGLIFKLSVQLKKKKKINQYVLLRMWL